MAFCVGVPACVGIPLFYTPLYPVTAIFKVPEQPEHRYKTLKVYALSGKFLYPPVYPPVPY